MAEEVTKRRGPLYAAAAAVVVATGFAGWAGWAWLDAGTDNGLDYARTRAAVLETGKTQVAELTTLDYHDVDRGIARWLEQSTGALHDRLAATDGATKKTLSGKGAVATGKVLDAAVSELDKDTGTARMLASVEISVAKDGTAPTTNRNRFAVALTRTPAGWKLSALDPIPVGAA